MAAPRNTYRNYPLVNDGEESLVGVPTANKVTLLDRFYLDDILVIQKQDEVTNATEYGIVGMVENGSQNYEMHNASRFFVLRGYENHIMLNDAGFNTKGKAVSIEVKSRFEIDGVEFKGVYSSAWFVDGRIEVRFRKVGSMTFSDWKDAIAIPQKSGTGLNFETSWIPWNVSELVPGFSVGDEIIVETRISNAEGVSPEFAYATDSVIIKPYLIKLRRGINPSSAWNSSALYDVYPSTVQIDIGTIFYEDEDMQSVFQGGTYMEENDGSWWALDTFGVVTSKGYYNPTSDVIYQGSLYRDNTSGNKFGEYTAQLFIRNNGSISITADPVTIVLGTLKTTETVIKTDNLDETFATHVFPQPTLAPSTETNEYKYDDIDIEYNYGTWVYIVLKNGVQIGQGYVA